MGYTYIVRSENRVLVNGELVLTNQQVVDYKKLVCIMKHIKNNMVDDGITDGNVISSFLVECLVYQVPNSTITACSSWPETVKQAIIFLYNEIDENRHTDWTEVSGMLYLFRGRKWTDLDAKNWLYQAWNYLGYGIKT